MLLAITLESVAAVLLLSFIAIGTVAVLGVLVAAAFSRDVCDRANQRRAEELAGGYSDHCGENEK